MCPLKNGKLCLPRLILKGEDGTGTIPRALLLPVGGIWNSQFFPNSLDPKLQNEHEKLGFSCDIGMTFSTNQLLEPAVLEPATVSTRFGTTYHKILNIMV